MPGPSVAPIRADACRPSASSCSERASRRGLLAALLAIAAIGGSADRARAACTADSPPLADGGSVTCTGSDETGFDATGFTGLTITTSGAARLDDSSALDAAIRVSDGNDVTIGLGARIDVVDDLGAGIRGGNDNFVTNEGMIVVDGANAVAIDVGSVIADDGGDADPTNDVDPVPTPTVTNAGTIRLNGVGSIGLRSVDNYDVVNASSGIITIEATATGGVGILGVNDNFVSQNGRITVDADGAWAVRIFDNTGLPLPNGAVFGAGSTTVVTGTGSRALEVGNNVGTAVSGTIELIGDDTRGVVIGNRSDRTIPADHTNAGTLRLSGANAIGLEFGNGWVAYADDGMGTLTPGGAGVRNSGRIEVVGSDAIGVFGGEDASFGNFAGNRAGRIEVVGSDAIGVSLGGNDLFDRWDFDDPNGNVQAYSFDASGGTLTGGPDAGPLLVFRSSTPGRENRVLIGQSGSIEADLTNLGLPDRGVAIRGSSGDEIVFNLGTIRGDVQLAGGDDRYLVNGSATHTGGTIDGGSGNDEVILGFVDGSVGVFDAATIGAFERIRVDGRDGSTGAPIGWRILNGERLDPTTEVFVAADGRLAAPANPDDTTAAVVLGGDLRIDPGGSVFVAPDGTTTPITVTGAASLDGGLVVAPTPRLARAGTFRLLQANGGIGATRFATETLPTAFGIFGLSTAYDAQGLDLIVTPGSFADAATTANRRAVGAHFDALLADGTADPELADVLDALLTTTGDLDDVYDALSPVAYDAQTTMIAESSRRLAHTLFDRPRDCRIGALDPWSGTTEPLDCHPRTFSAWSSVIGTLRERDGEAGRPEYDANMAGLLLGVDFEPIGELDLSFAIAAQRGQIDVSGAGKSDLVLANLMGQASFTKGPLRLQGLVTYGLGRHNDERAFAFDEAGTPVSARTSEDHTSHHVGVAGQVGLLFQLGAFGVEPIAGLDYAWIRQDEIAESGGGAFGLVIDDRDDSVLSATAGLRLSTVYRHDRYLLPQLLWMDGVWRPWADVRWRQYLLGTEREIDARLRGSPDTVGDYTIEGKEQDGGIEVGVGISFVPRHANRLQIDLQYDLFRADETLEHDLVAKLRFGF